MTVTSNIVLGVSAWQSSHAYSLGALATTSFPRCYQIVRAGTSASSGGPTGTGSSIIDGTVTWAYVCDVNYTTLQSWANAIPSTLTQPYVGLWVGSGLLNVDSSMASLTPILNFTGHTTSPTNTITLAAFPGFGFRDKLAVPGTPLAVNTSAVGLVVNLRNAEYDVSAVTINDANVILDGLQFVKKGPTSPAVFPGGASFVHNGHTYSIDSGNNILKDGVAVPGGDGTPAMAASSDAIWGEDGGSGDWFALTDGDTSFTGPSYGLGLIGSSSDNNASNFTIRNCIIDGITDNFGTAVVSFGAQTNFYNNLIFDRVGFAGTTSMIRSWAGAVSAGSVYVNNTIVHTYSSSSNIAVFISAPGNSGGYVFKNNISIGSGVAFNCAVTANGDHTAIDSTTPYSGSVVNGGGNVTSITASAIFVDPYTDFHLKTGASVINAGVSDTTHIPSATDIVGNPRVGSTWDIGAIEFTGSASAATKMLQFNCVASASRTAPAVNASATAAIAFTSAVNLTSQDRASVTTPALSFTASGQLGLRTLANATPSINIGVLFSFVRQEIFASSTNSLLITNAISSQQSDVCTLSQPIISLRSSSAATFNPWSAYGGGTITWAGGALLTHPTLASASANIDLNAAGSATILDPFDCTALATFSFTAQGTLQAPELIGLASLPITAAATAAFGITIIPAAGRATLLQFSAAASLSSFTNAASTSRLVISTAARSVGSDPVTAVLTPLTFTATAIGGQQLIILTPVITLPTLTAAGIVSSSFHGTARFSFTATAQAGQQALASGTSQILTLGTPQPSPRLLLTDGNTPVQLSGDQTNVWISDLVLLPWLSFPLRADVAGQPTVLLSTNTSAATTWPTITSASQALNSLVTRGTAALTFSTVATGAQSNRAAAAASFNIAATATAVYSTPARAAAALPTLIAASATAQQQDVASTAATASFAFVASGRLGQSNPVSATTALPIAVSAQAFTALQASAAIIFPFLGLGSSSGTAILGNGVNGAVPLLRWATAGSLEQDNRINAAASLPGLVPVASVSQQTLASATVAGLQISMTGQINQFRPASALITWPTLTAFSPPSLFASGTAKVLELSALGAGLNTTDYAIGQAALSFSAVGDAFNPPTTFVAGMTRLSQFAFAAGTASINAGQFSATISLQFGALAQCAQFVEAAAELSWTINMPTGIAQARLWTTPPNFVDGADTVFWSS